LKKNKITTKYIYYTVKGFFLIIALLILYGGQNTFYRFCRYPIPFVLCPICDYPCFFKQYQAPLIFSILGAGIFKGRVFCGMACPIGAAQDIIYIPASTIYKKTNINNRVINNINKFVKSHLKIEQVNLNIITLIDKRLRLLKYPILAISLLFSVITIMRFYDVMPNLLLAHAIRFVMFVKDFAGHDYKNTWYIFLLFTFIFGIFIHRAWCKYLCPVGLLFALTNKLSIFKIKVDKKECTGCKDCLDGCTTGYPVSKLEKGYNSLECVRCDRCIIQCKPNIVNADMRYFKSK